MTFSIIGNLSASEVIDVQNFVVTISMLVMELDKVFLNFKFQAFFAVDWFLKK